MSVLQCDRYGCENIMCDRLILNGVFYICNSCYSELLKYKYSWPAEMKKSDVERLIREFMDSPVDTHKALKSEEIDDEFYRLMGD